MTPAAGSSRQKHDNEAARQSTYQEIHAAILELYRLMGVPRTLPTTTGTQYFPGYAVYTYPAAAPQQQPRYQTLNAACLPAWASPVVHGQSAILNQYTQPSPTYVQPALPQALRTWATGAF